MPGGCVRVRPAPGVQVSLSEDGHLELFSETASLHLRCSPAGAAMWIALRQHDGDHMAAADTLARVWGKDRANMRADLDLWVDELLDAGLVSYEP